MKFHANMLLTAGWRWREGNTHTMNTIEKNDMERGPAVGMTQRQPWETPRIEAAAVALSTQVLKHRHTSETTTGQPGS
ncbi:MAG: hypothetical protein EBY17_02275 [Acidobacteriia bacterium]|nr:hypothetical protein [Terriglobia bacterium]